jgi:multicomponent Na+:H+ antiporter subunit C
MESLLAIVVGTLFSTGIYMILRRTIVKLIIGFLLLSHGVNLLIFTISGVNRGNAPLINEGDTMLTAETYADPLPQALKLTAIVISFAVTAFMIILIKRVYQSLGVDDLDEMRSTDKI